MSPMGELVLMAIRKGFNTPELIAKKIKRDPNFVHQYTIQLVRLGKIINECPTCKHTGYYVSVGNNK